MLSSLPSLAIARYSHDDDSIGSSENAGAGASSDNGFNVILNDNISSEVISHIRGKYEERLRKVSLANLSKVYRDIVNDEVLEEMKFDAISMKYVPAHIAEMLEKYLSSEREHLLTKLLSQVGILQYDIGKKQSVISNLSTKNIYLDEQHNNNKRQLEMCESENVGLKEEIARLKESNLVLKKNDVTLNIIAETGKNEIKVSKSVIDQLQQEKKDLVLSIEERDMKINNINNELIALKSNLAASGKVGKDKEMKETEYFNELKAVLQSTATQRDGYLVIANETSSKLQMITSEYNKLKLQLEQKIEVEKNTSIKISKILKEFEITLINEQNTKNQMMNGLNEKFKSYKHGMSLELAKEKKHNEILITELSNLKSYNESKKNENNALTDENIILKSDCNLFQNKVLTLEKKLQEKEKIENEISQNVKQLYAQVQIESNKNTSIEKMIIDEKYATNEITRKMNADSFDKQNKCEAEIAILKLKIAEETDQMNKKSKTLIETENLLNSYKYRLKEASDYLDVTSTMISSMKEEFLFSQEREKKHYESIINEKDAIIFNLKSNADSLDNIILAERVAQAKEIEIKDEEIRQLMKNIVSASENLYQVQCSEVLQASSKLETVLAQERGSNIKGLKDEIQRLQGDKFTLTQLNDELTGRIHAADMYCANYKSLLEREKLLEHMNMQMEAALQSERETSAKEIDLLSKMISEKQEAINRGMTEHKNTENLLQSEISNRISLKNRVALLEKIARAMAKEVKLYITTLLNDSFDLKEILHLYHHLFNEEYKKIAQAILKKSTALYDKLVLTSVRNLNDTVAKLRSEHVIELAKTEDIYKIKIIEINDYHQEQTASLQEKLSSMQETLRIIAQPNK